jgi:hypothetical protein
VPEIHTAVASQLNEFYRFLGNLPTWVTADDISNGWLPDLVADAVKVIRNRNTGIRASHSRSAHQ